DDEDGETIHTGRIVPVYEKTGAVTPKMQRRLVYDALQRLPPDLPDPLPDDIRTRLGLPARGAGLFATHFPPQGTDVGALHLLAALVAMENGLQVAFMAPTEVLAEQHAGNIARLLQASRFRVALLTGSTATAARRTQLAEIASGAVHLVVGTHALVQGDVEFR